MTTKSIMIVTVKNDQWGNAPTQNQINKVSRKIRKAVAEAGNTHSVVVVPETVKIETIVN